MGRGKLASLLFTAIVLSLFAQQSGVSILAAADVGPGLIEGTVHYDDGRPVVGATVYSQPMDRGMAGIVPHAKTDEAGHFAITHLWLGKFAVGAEKLDEDYPNMTMQFYSDGKFETVTLSSAHSAASVSIRLGPKAGILTGTVSDAVTGAPLNPCVEFRRAKKPGNFLSGTGLVNAKYRVLVPSNTGVLMKVWYGRHKPWYYPGTMDKAQSRAVTLKPGEETELEIRLEPDSSARAEGCGMPVGTVIKP
jgi:hypothetical protein